MSVHRIVCPDCGYVLICASLGARVACKTEPAFARSCVRIGEAEPQNALTCPVLAQAARARLRAILPDQFPTP